MTPSARLRQRLAQGDLLIAPGAYDSLSACLVEGAGFEACYMTGAGASAAHGFPDYGLLTLTEMAEHAGRMSRSVAIPLISDADTGYGNELNVTRTVREFEARGIAAIHIEDQVSPKRCGHLEGKDVIARDEFVSKIRAAVAARRNPDFVIIARTDARAVADFEEAVARANAALRAGADMTFVEAIENRDELVQVPQRVAGPCVLNLVPGGRTPLLDQSEARQMGYRLAIYPAVALLAATGAIEAALHHLRDGGPPEAPPPGLLAGFYRRLGSDKWDAIRAMAGGEED
ncbi:isocitrate lyase/PEP mutase family protein [Novosphingobium sp. SG707]|uniref:isocitrate lyase/PEP mutase family protein n=1 Tax=Novosphingobium sp. SG707 TaxID=2586996 RepID=UPI00144530FB|nr:isocitrate lyase/PEP mutase family protein [Novosphingobium sp. SG707]NKJ00965.1 2-methylisocitrate lyase-like PEP mutase family enzyme [Novosphingobium sp. SG707]